METKNAPIPPNQQLEKKENQDSLVPAPLSKSSALQSCPPRTRRRTKMTRAVAAAAHRKRESNQWSTKAGSSGVPSDCEMTEPTLAGKLLRSSKADAST